MYDPADYETRHPAVREIMRWFQFEHLPEGRPRYSSMLCRDLAVDMVQVNADSAELTAGLRKLLEAKDCFVRASIDND